MLDQMVARTIRDVPADLISVKAGINIVNGDTMRERTFGPALHGFLDTIRDGHPTTPLALVSPIVCPIVEDHPGPTLPGRDGQFDDGGSQRRSSRSAHSRCDGSARSKPRSSTPAATRATRTFISSTGSTSSAPTTSTDLYDGLHPTADGYLRIGERFHSLVFTDSGPFA